MLRDALLAETPTGLDHANALADFRDAMSVDQMPLMGNSYGSRLALCFTQHCPGRARKLVLTGTAAGERSLSTDDQGHALAVRAAQAAAGDTGSEDGSWRFRARGLRRRPRT